MGRCNSDGSYELACRMKAGVDCTTLALFRFIPASKDFARVVTGCLSLLDGRYILRECQAQRNR
eukprot:6214500-Pleurochrysis_carterae.AAC.4